MVRAVRFAMLAKHAFAPNGPRVHIDSGRYRPVLPLLIRNGAIPALASMAALIKLLGGGLSGLSIRRPRNDLRRCIGGLGGIVQNFGATILLPLAEATTMNFTTPIVIAAGVVIAGRQYAQQRGRRGTDGRQAR